MPGGQRTCTTVGSISPSASYTHATETQSGGEGKDIQLGKLGSGLTSVAGRPFSFGQAQCPSKSRRPKEPVGTRTEQNRSLCSGEGTGSVFTCSGVTRAD